MEKGSRYITGQLGIEQAAVMILQANTALGGLLQVLAGGKDRFGKLFGDYQGSDKSNAKYQGGDGWRQNFKSIDLSSKEFIAEPEENISGLAPRGVAKMADPQKPLAALQNPTVKRPKKASTRATRPKGRGAKLRPNRRRKRQTLSNQGTQSHEPTWSGGFVEFFGFMGLKNKTMNSINSMNPINPMNQVGGRVAVAPDGGRAARCSIYTIRRCF